MSTSHVLVLLLLLFACGAQLIAVQAQQNYDTLPQLYKNSINRAIKHANEKAKFHMNFFGVQTSEVTSSRAFFTFHLKPTQCSKGKHEHRNDCEFQKKRPLLNCAVCGDLSGDTLQEPFIDCRWQPTVNTNVEDNRKHKCHPKSLPGEGHLLSQKATEDAFQAECLGCF